MSKASAFLLLCIAVCIFCAVSGCTSQPASSSSTPGTTPVETSPAIVPVTETKTAQAAIVTTATVATVATTLEKSSFEAGADDPQILDLRFYKSYFHSGISNCIMKEALPEIAKDPEYGIKQADPKITGLSPHELNVFMWEYMVGTDEDAKTIGVSRCEGIPVTPYWNFIKIDARIMPRNANPADYDIGINVRSAGKVIAQFTVVETLIINQPLAFESYVPLKSEEMDLFDSIELVFHKRTS